jgi:hypothetical protein
MASDYDWKEIEMNVKRNTDKVNRILTDPAPKGEIFGNYTCVLK